MKTVFLYESRSKFHYNNSITFTLITLITFQKEFPTYHIKFNVEDCLSGLLVIMVKKVY